MLHPGTPRPSDEEILRQLREAVRKRRPWTRGRILIILALLTLPLLLVGWWMLPSAETPRLAVFAFDALLAPGEPLTLRAKVEPVDLPTADVRLAGFRVSFEEGHALPHPGQPVQRAIGISGKSGDVSVAWTGGLPTPVAEFVVRYHDPQRNRPVDDRARIFTWPVETSLLLVDVQSTLSQSGEAVWRNANILDIPPVPDAGKALQAVETKGYRVVYLSVEPERASLERKIRGWVENRFAARYPLGPVLGRSSLGKEATADGAREEILRDLRKRFTGSLIAMVGKVEAARISTKAGARALLLGPAIPPPGVERLAEWSDLAGQLPDVRAEAAGKEP